MSDLAVLQAERKREQLTTRIHAAKRQVKEWRKELRRVERFILHWHALADTGKANAKELGEVVAVARINSKKEEVAAATRKLIEAKGRPIRKSELHKLLVTQGLRIYGRDPHLVLSTMLRRTLDQQKLVRLKGGGYWLKERQYGRYRPGPDKAAS